MNDSSSQIIHVLNMNSIGGAESLVKTLLNSPGYNKHKVFYIANNSLSKFILTKSKLRILVILKATLILTIKVIRHDKNKSIFIFHLAECHLIFRIISSLLPVKKMQTVFIGYIHQGPKLYPKKLKKNVKLSALKADGIIYYSSQVKKAWDLDILFGMSYRSSVIHNFVSNQFFSFRNLNNFESRNYFQVIFIGRNTPWKRPKLAYELAKEIAKKGIRVNLKFLGLSQREGDLFIDHDLNPNLEIDFCGKVQNPISFLRESDIMFYLVDQDISEEGVGIAAMEALALGIPVVVSNKYKSDFSTLDLLIDLKEFTNNINKFELNKLNKYLRSLRKQKSIIPSNTKLFSFENYNDQLLNFTSQIFDGKVNIK
jgi:glycosyltransferase involved in cell wall biosynthesis